MFHRSPDGRWWWDGQQWQPVYPAPYRRRTDVRVVVVALAAVVMALAATLVVVHRSTDNGTPKNATTSPGSTPGPQSTGLGPSSDAPPDGLPVGRAAFDADARSIEIAGPVAGLAGFHLASSPAFSLSGNVVDATGRDLGYGTLNIPAGAVAFDGDHLVVATRLRIRADRVETTDPSVVDVNEPLKVAASRMTFQGTSSAPPGTRTTQPPPVEVPSPVTITTGGRAGGAVPPGARVVDLPADLHLSSNEADLSWAGSGFIAVGGAPVLRAGYLGVRAQDLDILIQRSGGKMTVAGRGRALQAFADGAPKLRTPARVDVVGVNARVGFFTSRPAFTWVPRNLGDTYDMAILRVRPGNDAARGAHLGLLAMPPMFGGEAHAPAGGVTDGLRGGSPIDSMIARRGNDKRDIGYDASPGAHLVLIVEGNFDPITVEVDVPSS